MTQYTIPCARGCGATALTGSRDIKAWRSFTVHPLDGRPDSLVTVCGPCASRTTAEEIHQRGIAASDAAMAWRVLREAEAVLREAGNQ